MAKANFLKEKADAFFEDANYDISRKKWFLAAFHLHQACQLYLKYYLFLKLRRYPKVHSLEELLKGIGKVYSKQKEIENVLEKKASTIGDLDQAYLTSRYLPVEFSEQRIKNMLNFTKDLLKFLKKL
ncbi:MAG: HEPN domain-containing protein [Patescibacteria group bacterium]|nr:HEPN domain-containing protein [Patescibacteria group bacterium]